MAYFSFEKIVQFLSLDALGTFNFVYEKGYFYLYFSIFFTKKRENPCEIVRS